MSTGILAAPDLSLNVRYTRKVQENRGEVEEHQVEILEDEEHHADLGSRKAGPHTQKNPSAGKRRCFKAPAVTLGVMYLLILAGLYKRYISAILEKDQLQRTYDNLRNNHSQFQDEVKQLQGQKSDMAVNNSQLQDEVKQLKSKVKDMAVNYSQLQDEVKQLKSKTEGKWCPEGWKRFGCSCYFKSNEKKTWEESRKDCQNKGGDLVIINNKEEQEFVRELNKPGASWIGLKAEYIHKPKGWEPKWDWVDGSLLTVMFWETGHSQKTWYQYVQCCNNQGKWTQSKHYNSNNWICEKTIDLMISV